MKQNETLKAMLAGYQPDLDDADQYIGNINRRLDSIEPVKRMYERDRRLLRSRMVVSFISGGITGVVTTICLLIHPVAIVSPNRYLSDWLATNVNNIINILAILAFSVMVAIVCTLAYQIYKKDYLSPTALN